MTAPVLATPGQNISEEMQQNLATILYHLR